MNGFVSAFLKTLALVVGVLFLFFFQATQETGWLIAGGFLVALYFLVRFTSSPPKAKVPALGSKEALEHD